jgi:hypothetical protein
MQSFSTLNEVLHVEPLGIKELIFMPQEDEENYTVLRGVP